MYIGTKRVLGVILPDENGGQGTGENEEEIKKLANVLKALAPLVPQTVDYIDGLDRPCYTLDIGKEYKGEAKEVIHHSLVGYFTSGEGSAYTPYIFAEEPIKEFTIKIIGFEGSILTYEYNGEIRTYDCSINSELTPPYELQRVDLVWGGDFYLCNPDGIKDGLTPYIKDGNWWIGDTDTGVKAEGRDGVGISKVEKTATNGNIDTYTITYTNGSTFTFTVTNGLDGFSPTVSVEAINGGHRVVITDKDGEKKVNILDGADGRGIYSISKLSTNGFVDTYQITFTDATTATFTVTNGRNGTSVTITSIGDVIDETTEEVIGHTVNFSDGTTLTVNNGSKGEKGDTGDKGDQGEKGDAYTLTSADKTEIADEVATKIPFVKSPEAPTFVNSVEGFADTSKTYVLCDKNSPDDGYIFAFMAVKTEGEAVPNFTNVMDDPNASIRDGERYSYSGKTFKGELTDCSIIIPISAGRHTIRVRGAGDGAKYNNYIYFDLNNDGIYELSSDDWSRTVQDNGDIVITTPNLSSAGLATFAVATGFNKADLIVTIDEEITYTVTEDSIVYKWANTGRAFVPTDYEERIVELESKVQENANEISDLKDEINKPKPTGIVTMFISPSGDDNNSGLTVNYPKKTVKACVSAGATRISAKRGTYNEEVSLSNIDTLEIFPTDNNYTNKDVHRYPPIIFDTSDTIAVSSLVTYNNIKSVAYAKQNTALEYVFTNGFYDTVHSTIHGYYAVLWLITDNIKNDIKLRPVATISEVESNTNTFTWSNNTLYLNANLTDVKEIRVPTSYNNAFTISTANKVKLTEVEIDFAGRYNLFIENCPVVEIDNCSVKYSSNGSGFDLKSANGILRNCYASRVHDGYGIGGCGHTVFIDCTAEWCFDDGMSHHTKCTGTVIGGRFEGNRKGGNVPAYGANVNIYGGLYKDNQMYGVAYITDSTHKPSTGIVQGAVIVGNDKGLLVDDTCNVTALNCHYVGNTEDKDITGTLTEY